ncbi:MAG TPA: hypothetical protein PKD70_06325 [Saprospiraceae bacterium]|nr:hypothetical protein [Saprospiraceae bacterium]HMP13474.1 hypothetical protein [Saprospiraceae bacterium]
MDKPKAFRTYTKISWNLREHVYFVYANLPSNEGFSVVLPGGGSAIGYYDPQPSADGKYLNWAFLFYMKEEDTLPFVTQLGHESDFSPNAWLVHPAADDPNKWRKPEIFDAQKYFVRLNAPVLFFRPKICV